MFDKLQVVKRDAHLASPGEPVKASAVYYFALAHRHTDRMTFSPGILLFDQSLGQSAGHFPRLCNLLRRRRRYPSATPSGLSDSR